MKKSFLVWLSWKRIEEERRNWIIRREIDIARTSWAPEIESEAVKRWIEAILRQIWIKLDINNLWDSQKIRLPWSFKRHKRVDYYQKKVISILDYIPLQEMWNLVEKENERNYNLLVLDKNMVPKHEIFNSDIHWAWLYPHVLISTYKDFSKLFLSSFWLLWVFLSFLAAHELCHVFDLVNRDFNYSEWHCAWESGPCLMENPSDSLEELYYKLMKIISREHWLCSDCMDEIAFKKGSINWDVDKILSNQTL